jgi:SAM-dependent methyltransferase
VKIHDPRLELAAVRAQYNNPAAYNSSDSWHRFTEMLIRKELARVWSSLPTKPGNVILNAGSGGNDLGLCPDSTINLDISEVRVARLPNPVVGSIEALPFATETIDMILCVGSVINYCDAAAAISEFGRVLRPRGQMVLEFESSRSAELMTQDAFGQTVAVAETFYADQKEVVWVYSPEHIKNLLVGAGFTIVRRVPVHVLSPWMLLMTRSVSVAAAIARLDRLARRLPIVSRWASNHLLFCQKPSA